jgi:RNA polymerase sigma-B factor
MVERDNNTKLKTDENKRLKEHLYLVEKIVHNFTNVSESQETLEEVGYIGLLNAINLYDQEKSKLDFKSYAQIIITKEIHQYLTDHTYKVEQPLWLVKLNKKISYYVIEYRHKYKKCPTLSEIADHLNLTEIALQEVLKGRESLKDSYLYYQIEYEFNKVQPDLGKIKSKTYQPFKLPIQDVITLQKAFMKIKKLQRNIIYYLFIMDLRQPTLSQENVVSNERTKQIKNNIFHNL